MSVIACRKAEHGWEIGSDRAITYGDGVTMRTTTELYDRQNIHRSKIVALAPGVLAGFAGWGLISLFRVHYQEKYGTLSGLANAGQDELTMVAAEWMVFASQYPERYRSLQLLLINNLGAWEICDMSVQQVNEYTAIGSGALAALAAMDCDAGLHRALRIATERDAFCGGGVEVVRMCDQIDGTIQPAASGGLT